MSAPVSPSSTPDLTPEYIAFTNAHVLLAQASSIFAIAAAVVVARIYVRVHIVRSFGKDDCTMVLAMCTAKRTLIPSQQDKSDDRVKLFQCTPIAAAWDTRLRPPPIGRGTARCFTMQTFAQIGMFNSIVNILTDFLLALLPVPLIWRLQLNMRTKVSLILVLSLGLFACVAGIMKTRLNKTILSDPNRFIYDGYSMWNFIELDVGIIAGSLPAVKPLFNRFLDVARGMTSRPSKSSDLGGHNVLGYKKHVQRSDHDIALAHYRNHLQPSVDIPAQVSGSTRKTGWDMGRVNSSEDSILANRDLHSYPNAIMVTREVRVG
ncbi:hypothetical protein OPT61_g1456 [Boeremia exigua]|uniref:Uncharacterized protein n=1 Tax=Boeremia exigua TaxID=749465 RepID=A0ACC2IQ44_9PLEO|nr:hypothetical protein OPT61_g1456 [Boeremia exigua]